MTSCRIGDVHTFPAARISSPSSPTDARRSLRIRLRGRCWGASFAVAGCVGRLRSTHWCCCRTIYTQSGRYRPVTIRIPNAEAGSKRNSQNAGCVPEARNNRKRPVAGATVAAASGNRNSGNTRWKTTTISNGISITHITIRSNTATSSARATGSGRVSTAGSGKASIRRIGPVGMKVENWISATSRTQSGNDVVHDQNVTQASVGTAGPTALQYASMLT